MSDENLDKDYLDKSIDEILSSHEPKPVDYSELSMTELIESIPVNTNYLSEEIVFTEEKKDDFEDENNHEDTDVINVDISDDNDYNFPENDEEFYDDDEYDEENDEYEDDEPPKRVVVKRFAGGGIIFGLLLTSLIVGVSILSSAYLLMFGKEMFGIDKSDMEIVIDIPEFASSERIVDMLVENGIVKEKLLFQVVARLQGADGSFIEGPHTLRPNMTYNDMIKELTTRNTPDKVRAICKITLPEGITLFEAAERLEAKQICDSDEFIQVFNSSDFGYDFEELVRTSSLKFYRMEGYLFPDTYEFYIDEDPRVVAKTIYKNFQFKITADLYGRMEDMEMELEDVLTFASIVQAEARTVSDMKMVASVFHNRLANPDVYPKLESDPTSVYVREVIIPNSEIFSGTLNDAYDTYIGAGLPPGPIGNPGLDAINAVLYPAESEYYYFCANVETGEVFYAKTLAEHEQNLVTAGITVN